MKRLTLTTAQVLATDNSIPTEDPHLKIYFHVFAKGGGESLPPIIVGKIASADHWIRRLEEGYARWCKSELALVELRRSEYHILFRKLKGSPYFILDGNHRALAAALTRHTLSAIYVDDDHDIAQIHHLVNSGELLSFHHEAKSVGELEGLFIKRYLHLNEIPPNHSLDASRKRDVEQLVSVATRTYDLATGKRLPPYMVKNYTQRKPPRLPALPFPHVKKV